MKKFDSNELELLRGNFSSIGKSISSSRSRTGHISNYYVHLVLTGKVDRDNATTRAIIRKAERIIAALKV